MRDYDPASDKVREYLDQKGFSPDSSSREGENKEIRISPTNVPERAHADGKWVWENGSWKYIG